MFSALEQQELGEKLLEAAEAGGKVGIHVEEYGPSYLFDAERLRKLLGRLFAPRLPAVVALCASLRWANISLQIVPTEIWVE
jgi:hypothetical protein